MRSLNRVIVTGHLGKDPETTQAGTTTVTKFSIAVNDEWKGDGGKKEQRTNWLHVAVFNGAGEPVAEYLKTGAHVLVEGALRTSEWEDKETGQKRWKTEIVASQVLFLQKKQDARKSRAKSGPRSLA